MNGKKAKAFRKLTEVVFKNLPDYKFKEYVFPKTYLFSVTKAFGDPEQKSVTLKNTQRRMVDCKRRRYKMLKKIYKRNKHDFGHQSAN